MTRLEEKLRNSVVGIPFVYVSIEGIDGRRDASFDSLSSDRETATYREERLYLPLSAPCPGKERFSLVSLIFTRLRGDISRDAGHGDAQASRCSTSTLFIIYVSQFTPSSFLSVCLSVFLLYYMMVDIL